MEALSEYVVVIVMAICLAVGYIIKHFLPLDNKWISLIMGALAMGIERRTAAEFSFFLAVPTMIGAASLQLWDSRAELMAGTGPV